MISLRNIINISVTKTGVQIVVRLSREFNRQSFTPDSASWKGWKEAVLHFFDYHQELEGMSLCQVDVNGHQAQFSFKPVGF